MIDAHLCAQMGDALIGGEVRQALHSLGLSTYAKALIEDGGYESIDLLRSLEPAQLEAIADDVSMKPGHKLKFVQAFSAASTQQRAIATSQVDSQRRATHQMARPEVMDRGNGVQTARNTQQPPPGAPTGGHFTKEQYCGSTAWCWWPFCVDSRTVYIAPDGTKYEPFTGQVVHAGCCDCCAQCACNCCGD